MLLQKLMKTQQSTLVLSADIADVIVADHNFFQSAMLTSSLLITASSNRDADIIVSVSAPAGSYRSSCSELNLLHLPFFLLQEGPLEDESPSLAPGELISSTNIHQPQLCVTHLFYAYVRKATNTEFNVFVLGRDLIFVCDSLANQFCTSLKICE
ncbi:hypothetical protein F511_32136 [Dorcoceras hygrometricum]|uniref:Uncharacterized protein n=1 Tax=Dorcoceras hygrometricum TaxID=472368 RepID=A0A2Z7CZR6_9LAMI|nr:hypothetical protein F511_32136 [Dorcoceras hygrometricum]